MKYKVLGREVEIKVVKIKDLKPYKKNARTHPKKQIDLLVENIKRFGFLVPIGIDKNKVIIAGHGRLEALKILKADSVPCVLVDYLNEKEINALRLADNKLAEMSGWEEGLAIGDLKELDDELLGLTGFDKDLLIEPDAKDDIVPDVKEKTKVKLGDIYQLGNHRIMCGDATKIEDVEKLMDGKKADMVFTDPPYNVDYTGGTKEKLKIKNDKFKVGEFYQFLYNAIGAFRPHVVGDVYISMSSSELDVLQKAFRDNNGHWSTFIIWIKDRFTLGRSNYQRQYEPILYGWFEGSSHYWSGRRNLGDIVKEEIREDVDGSKWLKLENENVESDIWEFEKPNKSKEHPTMKPVSLMNRAIINSSLPQNIVLDTFLGSGSTLIACEKTNRICYGMELDPKYIQVIIDRFEDYTGQRAKKVG